MAHQQWQYTLLHIMQVYLHRWHIFVFVYFVSVVSDGFDGRRYQNIKRIKMAPGVCARMCIVSIIRHKMSYNCTRLCVEVHIYIFLLFYFMNALLAVYGVWHQACAIFVCLLQFVRSWFCSFEKKKVFYFFFHYYFVAFYHHNNNA